MDRSEVTNAASERQNSVVELQPVDNDELANVVAGRNYGWEYGGWICACKAPPPQLPGGSF
jgi:hypothetical protein